jgi:hypothetical protein
MRHDSIVERSSQIRSRASALPLMRLPTLPRKWRTFSSRGYPPDLTALSPANPRPRKPVGSKSRLAASGWGLRRRAAPWGKPRTTTISPSKGTSTTDLADAGCRWVLLSLSQSQLPHASRCFTLCRYILYKRCQNTRYPSITLALIRTQRCQGFAGSSPTTSRTVTGHLPGCPESARQPPALAAPDIPYAE